jgi:eukaryotic-like serine/threonine-protein kinase
MSEASEQNSIKPEELQAFLRQYRPEHPLKRERDVLSERYRIMVDQPIPHLSSLMAKAFAVRDVQTPDLLLYALVFDSNAMPRKKTIAALKGFRHPNLVALLDEGAVEISLYSESRYVVVMERPAGKPLSELLSKQQRNPVVESTVINHLIRPFAEILKAFAAMGISHNRINLSNVYLNNTSIQLGECISEPSGYSQDFLFEPIDRLLASPYGKPDYAIDADCYATGVLALHFMVGFQPFANMSRDDFINSLLTKGAYHTLIIQWDISENLQDLFRALINDSKRDRCAPEPMENWLGGRRFNLVLPAVNQETARGFEFCGKLYYNRKALAHALFLNWNEGKAILLDTKLPRWLETSVHKKEVADVVSRIASSSFGEGARAERQNNELLTRIIIALDPSGPIRFKTLSFTPEGTGTLLAHLYFSGDQNELQTLLHAIESDLAAQWIEQQKGGVDYSAVTSRLQKVRSFLRLQTTGFGIERCLYDFHPSLSCQSPLVKRLAVTTLPEIIYALDVISTTQKASETDFMDTHIAAFIASKLELGKEIRVHELDAIKELAANPKLVALKLFARVQHSVGSPSVKGLTHWIVLRLFPMLDYIHRRNVRHHIQHQLKDAASSGMIGKVTDILLSPEAFVNDYNAFRKAVSAYTTRKYQIARLKDPRERTKHARMVGRGLAQTLAYGTSAFTIYFTLRSYYHF